MLLLLFLMRLSSSILLPRPLSIMLITTICGTNHDTTPPLATNRNNLAIIPMAHFPETTVSNSQKHARIWQ